MLGQAGVQMTFLTMVNHVTWPDLHSRLCRRKDYWRAKYKLVHVVRTHMGAKDAHYNCVYQQEDSEGRVGVHLSKDLVGVAGHALKANLARLGPLVLPISEQLKFLGNTVALKVGRSDSWVGGGLGQPSGG